MNDPKRQGPGDPATDPSDPSEGQEIDVPLGEAVTDWRSSLPATYGLEMPVVCGSCRQEIDKLYVVRLYRAKVNFVSSLPRSGRVLVCPNCRTIVPGELGGVL